MKVRKSLEKLSSAILITSMVLGLFASPVLTTGTVVKAQDEAPTPIPTEVVVDPTAVPEEPTLVPEEPTAVPEEPTAVPEEPTLEPTTEPTLEPTAEPTLEPTLELTTEPTLAPTIDGTTSPTPTFTPTVTLTPTIADLPLVVPVIEAEGNSAIPDKYIVVYKEGSFAKASSTDGDGASIMEADINSAQSLGATIENRYTSALTGFSASLSPEALKKLRQNPDIDYIEQDQVVSINDDIEVNSIQDNATWGLDRIDQTSGLDGKYTYFYNGTGVHAYVIDTGILPTHPEFGGRATKDFDAFDNATKPNDCNGHGTHVAGTIGGTTYGVAKNVIIHAVRVLDCDGRGTSSQVLSGIDYVTANHMSPAVANMSLGGYISTAENQAVARAIASGVTFVVAAGNDTDNACYYSPASAPAAITVGATDLTDSPSSFSNYGSCLDIFAPGTNITSSWNNGGYNTINGTSMASPHVAGAAALLLQANPSASPATITNLLLGNAVNGLLHNVGNGSPNKMLFTKPLPNPTAPGLLLPAVGASLKTNDPVLSWKSVTGATLYRLQIATTSDFLSPDVDTDSSDTSYEAIGTDEGLHYWRVMSKNPLGIESPWSDVFSFIIDTTPPVAPTLTYPGNGDVVTGTPTLTWNAVSDAVGYMVEVDDSNTFTSPVLFANPVTTDGTPVTTTSIKPSTLAAGGTYYWHVRSIDKAGNWGDWSSPLLFSTSSPVPGAPTLSSPASGAVLVSSTPALTWNAVDYGDHYQIEISKDPTFIDPSYENVTKGAGVLTHTVASGMIEGTKYYWHVRAFNNSSQSGPWSEMRNFTLDLTGPAAPVLSLPAAFSTYVGIPTFTWTAPATATAYQFQYSTDGFLTDPAFSTPEDTPITTTSFKPSSLTAGLVYTWRVRARDAYGNWSVWSDTRWVNVQASLPATPVVTAPVAGYLTNNPAPDFAWNSVSGAVTYEIQVDNLSTFASPEITDSTSANSYTPSSPLTADGVYYYRVRAVNATGGPGAWSTTRSFTLDTLAPGESTLTTPLAGATPVGTPTFIWAAVTGANAYQFQYSTDSTFSTIDYSTAGPTYPGTPLAVTSHKPAVNMTVGTPYYWHVRARDAAGNWGDWTGSRLITVQAAIPGVPVLTSPVIALITNNTTPAFTWNTVTDAATYDIQIDNLSTFASPEIAESISTNSFTPSSPLPSDGIYYWRVRAVNITGGAGSWSAGRAFTLDTVAPAAPALSTPVDGATPIGTPTFVWAGVTGANAYQFQYSVDFNFATVDYSTPGDTVPGTPLAISSHKPTVNMTVGTHYYWRTRARDAAGNWGDWSSVRLIIVQATLPGVPVVTAPAVGLVTNNTTPTFTWNTVSGAASYDVQIDNLSTFASPEVTGNVGTNTFTPSSAITPDAIYYYRIRAINITGGAGVWSAARSFTLDTTAPAAPALTSPLNGATPVGTPTFTWVVSAGANAYQYQYSTDNTFATVDYSTPGDTVPGTPLTVTLHKPTVNMTVGTTYYWRARARDLAGNWGAWSTVRSIITQAALPVAPVVTAPAVGLTTNNTTPTFTWNTVSGAVSYDVQIDNLATFASPEVAENVGTNSFTPSSPITPDALYYYRVRAVNVTGGQGPWSAVRAFTLDTLAPPAVVLSLPADAATPIGTPIFYWAVAAGANAYQYQYSSDSTFSSIEYSTPGDTVPGTPLAVTSHKPTVNMTVGTTYYWRVRARDLAGNWGDWSTSRSIIVQATLPPAPVVTAPAIGLVTNNTTPTFTWNAVSAAISYDIQIDNQSTFASPEVSESAATNSFTLSSPIAADGLYYWRVRSVNITGGAGAWAAVRTFTLDTSAPAAPVLSSPLDAATPVGTPTFIWAAVTGANAYQYEYSADSGFSSIDYSTPGETVPGTPLVVTSHKPSVNMVAGTPYYWRVRARDAAGNWGAWSTARTIVVQAALPGIPVVTAPTVNQLISDTTPTIRWNSVTDAVSYDIQIDNLITFASPEATGNVATTSFTPSSVIKPDGLYYYRVRAINITGGAGSWSATRAFTIDSTPPAVPALSLPANASRSVGNPTFTWVAVAGAKNYELQISLASNMSSPLSLTPVMPVAVNSYKPATVLNAMTTYYWRVRAQDFAGNLSNWTSVRSVTILPPVPAAPVLSSPATSSFTNDAKPVFTWVAAANASSYRIQISSVSTFATTIVNTSLYDTTFQPGNSLGSDGIYYWRVQSVNALEQASTWSAARMFTLDTVAPAAPVLSAPVEGTILPAGIPTFSWAAVAGANAYQFQMDDFAGHVFATPGGPAAEFVAGTPLAVTSYKPTSMTPGLLYYWRVRARDVAGNWSAWSNYRRVIEQAPLPAAPVLVSPSDLILTSLHYTAFTWNSAANAVKYEIQVDKYSTFIGLDKIDTTLGTGELNYSLPDYKSGDLYWRVRGLNVNGMPGPWSAVRKLTIEFDSSFASDSTGWIYSTSQWTVSGGALVAPGTTDEGYYSLATYDGIYSNFTFETSMKMGVATTAPSDWLTGGYGIFVHTNSSSSNNDFTSGYYFEIGTVTDFTGYAYRLSKVSNGVRTLIKSWTKVYSLSYSPGGYNTIKAISNGSILAYYVNGDKVIQISNPGPLSGKVGVSTFWWWDQQSTYVDWARISAPSSTSSTEIKSEALDVSTLHFRTNDQVPNPAN